MYKKIFIGVVVLGVLGLLISILYMLNAPDVDPEKEPTSEAPTFPIDNGTAPIVEEPVVSNDPTMVLRTVDGKELSVKNFLRSPETIPDKENEGYYNVGNHFPDPSIESPQNPPYVIEYIASTGYFNIALFQNPIKQVRLDAETYLMNQLGISEEQMCLLDYMISVPDSVNTEFSGMNLGFSFCPDSVKLP